MIQLDNRVKGTRRVDLTKSLKKGSDSLQEELVQSPRTVQVSEGAVSAPREKKRPLLLASEEKGTSSCIQQPTTKKEKPKIFAKTGSPVLSLTLHDRSIKGLGPGVSQSCLLVVHS